MDLNQLDHAVSTLERKIGDATLYELLGLQRDASDEDIKSAFHRVARLLHVDNYARNAVPGELQGRMEAVMGELSRARQILSDPAQREEYDAMLSLSERGVPTDVGKIFEADSLFKGGVRLVDRGVFDEARKRFQAAIDINPTEPDYWAYLRWAEFCLLDTDRKARPTEPGAVERIRRHLDKLAEENPRCDDARLFLGHIAKAEGDQDAALKHYKSALRINRENTAAQSNIRLLKQREKKRAEGGFFAKLFGR